jgi:PAS domain S-box-containing protein
MVDLVEVRTRELKESEERFRTLIQNSNDIFCIIDDKGVIRLLSPSVMRITGFTPAELMNKSVFDYIHDEDKEEVFKIFNELLNHPFELFTVQFRYYMKGGGFCYLEAVSQNLVDIPGVHGIVVNLRDVTERKLAEDELRNAKQKAEEMNRVKSSFFANMSHELRTPLHGILGISQILEDQIITPNKKHLVEMLSQSGKRLLNTLNMILNLSRVEANKLDINYTRVNICQVIRDNIRLYEPSAIQKQLKLEYVSDCKDFMIDTDEQMLVSVLNNMIDNAIKYTNKGSVKVFSGIEKIDEVPWAVIKVQDTGIGISEADQKIIFDEFRQASEGYSRSFEGTGLGLSIMKKYIELLNGKISVESILGVGSIFTVYLPFVDYSNGESEEQKFDGIPDNVSYINKEQDKFRVLLVDDEEITFNIVSIWLNNFAKVEYAENATEAIKKLNNNKFNCVIMDINLKRGGNGIDVLKELRKIMGYENTPVIACTAYAMHGDKENLLNEGFNFYLSKPFEKEDLMELINGLLK